LSNHKNKQMLYSSQQDSEPWLLPDFILVI